MAKAAGELPRNRGLRSESRRFGSEANADFASGDGCGTEQVALTKNPYASSRQF